MGVPDLTSKAIDPNLLNQYIAAKSQSTVGNVLQGMDTGLQKGLAYTDAINKIIEKKKQAMAISKAMQTPVAKKADADTGGLFGITMQNNPEIGMSWLLNQEKKNNEVHVVAKHDSATGKDYMGSLDPVTNQPVMREVNVNQISNGTGGFVRPENVKFEPWSNPATKINPADDPNNWNVKTATPQEQTIAQAMVDGKVDITKMTGTMGAGKTRERLISYAQQLDPGFDMTNFPTRIAMRRDYATGIPAKNLLSLNTVIGHLNTLNDKANALDNTKIVKYNTLKNYLSKEIGNPQVTGFNNAKQAVINELSRTFQGVGQVTQEERDAFSADLNNAQSKEQTQQAISTYIDLIKSRTDAVKANWEQTFPNTKTPVPILNEKSKGILKKFGYDPNTMEKVDNSSSNQLTEENIQHTLKLHPELKNRQDVIDAYNKKMQGR